MSQSNPPPDSRDDLIHALDDRPAPGPALLAAVQHVLACFIAIVTPTLVIAGILGLDRQLPYLLSMGLMVSGVGTFLQARRPWGIGAGMICVQGTSFSFLGAITAAGLMVQSRGGSPDDMLAMIFGLCFFGAFVEIFLSRFLHQLRRIFTPLVTGIVITIIGMSLIPVGMTSLGGGDGVDNFGDPGYLGIGALTLLIIVILGHARNAWLRLSAIAVALAIGTLVAWLTGVAGFTSLEEQPLISLPIPFRYGFDFEWSVFLPIAMIYLITAIESVGDLTANCLISRQPIEGPRYLERISGGVLGDGVNSMLAAVFNTFPNTTFSQNNGVIQLSGVASRHVGQYVGVILVILGLFPTLGAVLSQIPQPVLGGALLMMFGSVAAAGIRILARVTLNRRSLTIMAVAFGVGLGVASSPEIFDQLPEMVRLLLGSSISAGGLVAIVLNLLLPDHAIRDQVPSRAETERSAS
ncbi:uracil-xanthine permease family protein [Kushneria indalinina]|uniref:Xanthine permease XanP n=1 Tax=Kushneria indalinina DSM 14324 TaxID=1122140 RepID=A0A3D9DW33_9GAMM|nr:nucleobase:cation symporter-2 family protein [Kushneria indalinina]REC94609.1 xanthine permease XanP [Kushneria indalinina DSM 14324]